MHRGLLSAHSNHRYALTLQGLTEAEHLEGGLGQPRPRNPVPQSLGLESFHSAIREASLALLSDGHHARAVEEAFKRVELKVRELTGIADFGKSLMGVAFGGDPPPLSVATVEGLSAKSEQEGFKLLFMGAMAGIRNIEAHEVTERTDIQWTLEHLALASLLMRRLDLAKRPPGVSP